jgi:hypothetical protein
VELPWFCSKCGYENMIDLQNLSEWPVDKLITAQGFSCEHCGAKEAVSHTTASLLEAERKLTRYQPGQKQFEFHFRKLLRKAQGVNARGEIHGALQHSYMAEPGSMV